MDNDPGSKPSTLIELDKKHIIPYITRFLLIR